MRRVVLIDGENLLHGLRALAGTPENLLPREKVIEFPLKALIEEVLGDNKPAQMLYYGARLRRYNHDASLVQKTERAIKLQARLVSSLQRQGISFVKVGYLRARETDACPKCGYHEWHLLEKGVDVGLAVRMLSEASKAVEIVLISSDTDLLPAVNAARAQGAKIIFVGYEYQPIVSLVKAADLTRIITSPMVAKHLPKK